MGELLHGTDRFTREFAALEEENNRYKPVENVTDHVQRRGRPNSSRLVGQECST